jgi:cephalosporin hydroxylase
MHKTLKQIIKDENLSIEIDPKYGTDKGGPKSYIENFYEEKFSTLADSDITLVEIGVRSGASLKLWREYFSKANIIGIDDFSDLNDHQIPVNKSWIYSKNVKFIIGDAYNEEVANQIRDKIDILIDDGPHTFESHVQLLSLYLPRMNKNGIIIIEDISYDYNRLYSVIPEQYRDTSVVHDFGGYDNRLIVIGV